MSGRIAREGGEMGEKKTQSKEPGESARTGREQQEWDMRSQLVKDSI